jgi:NAD+ diphosphatase
MRGIANAVLTSPGGAASIRRKMTKERDFGPPPRQAYSGSLLERAANFRGDDAKLAALYQHRRAGVYVIGGESIVLKAQRAPPDPLHMPDEARALGTVRETVFLGLVDDAPRFGVGIDAAAADALKSRSDLKLIDLRTIAVQGEVDAVHLPPLAEAKAILGWHARHRFCPNCSAATVVSQAGWRRDCPACKAEHFPRTDPVVIMLPIAGERCVLGRSPRFPPTMWSCLAGFCEPGESLEEAVRREVAEEVGLTCAQVRYFDSQPWPFPSSLMIGCHARAVTEQIVIDKSEIEEARWFDRAELNLMLARQHPDGLSTPPPIAIAHHIIRDFIERGSGVLVS